MLESLSSKDRWWGRVLLWPWLMLPLSLVTLLPLGLEYFFYLGIPLMLVTGITLMLGAMVGYWYFRWFMVLLSYPLWLLLYATLLTFWVGATNGKSGYEWHETMNHPNGLGRVYVLHETCGWFDLCGDERRAYLYTRRAWRPWMVPVQHVNDGGCSSFLSMEPTDDGFRVNCGWQDQLIVLRD